MNSPFWKPYSSKNLFDSKKKLSHYPFFHSSGFTEYGKIVNDYWLLQALEEDKFHKEKSIFFFYANPVYLNPKWDFPIILGVDFKEMNNAMSLFCSDSGLCHNLCKKEGTRHFKKGVDYFRNDFVEKGLRLEEMNVLISNYIEEWFGDINNYCSALLNDNFKSQNIDSHDYLLGFFNENLKDFYDEGYLEENQILLDKRKRMIELAIFRHVNLPRTSILRYAAVPSNGMEDGDNEYVNGLMRIFNIPLEEKNAIFFEYPRRNKEGARYSLKYLTSLSIKNYYKKFDIEVTGDVL